MCFLFGGEKVGKVWHMKKAKRLGANKKKWGTPTMCENSPKYEIIN